MEEHLSRLTEWVNHVLGPIARGILHAFHVQPIDPHHPIPEYLVMSVVVLMLARCWRCS